MRFAFGDIEEGEPYHPQSDGQTEWMNRGACSGVMSIPGNTVGTNFCHDIVLSLQ